MPEKYRGDTFAPIHEALGNLHEMGAINKQTMREFNETYLTPMHVLELNEIKLMRQREHIYQRVLSVGYDKVTLVMGHGSWVS